MEWYWNHPLSSNLENPQFSRNFLKIHKITTILRDETNRYTNQERDVRCLREDGAEVPPSKCAKVLGPESKPAETQQCTSRAACFYGWRQPPSWDDASVKCSNTCGRGTKQRETRCEVQTMQSPLRGEEADDSFCTPVADAAWLKVDCYDFSSCCYEWAAGDWQDDKCTEACGPSVKPREVRCERRTA